jgi:DHA2 family multidrug resistance protein
LLGDEGVQEHLDARQPHLDQDLSVCGPLLMQAQTANTGAIAGSVNDLSGALVAGGALVVRSQATQEERDLTTDAQGIASASGLLLSGFLTDRVNWRLICVPNIFLGTAALWLLHHNFPDLPKSESQRLQHTDGIGLCLLAAGILSLQIVLSRGHIDDWFESPDLRFLAVISAASLIAFVRWERSADNRYPLMDMSLLKNRNVLAAVLIGLP